MKDRQKYGPRCHFLGGTGFRQGDGVDGRLGAGVVCGVFVNGFIRGTCEGVEGGNGGRIARPDMGCSERVGSDNDCRCD